MIYLWHDPYLNLDRFPLGAVPAGSAVRLRLRVVGESERAFVRLWRGGGEEWAPMRALSDSAYEADVPVGREKGLLWYYFVVDTPDGRVYAGKPEDDVCACYDHEPPSFQITVYDPAFEAPEWMRDSVMMQIMVDRFFIGGNVRDAAAFGGVWTLAQDAVLERCERRCAPSQLPERMVSDGTMEALPQLPVPERYAENWEILPSDGQAPLECPDTIGESLWAAQPARPMLKDVYEGKTTLDAFVDLLSDEQMVRLLGGQPNRGVANTLGWGNQPRFGVPNVMTADGPAGLRILEACGVTTTAFPCATLLCCSWDPALLQEVGRAAALEVRENGFGVWLAPAINIHRSPLCGRNFEYYSEDPLLAGRLAAEMIRGIQREGVACSLKHFACNNKETNRRNSDSRVSERALREIYLRAFEICVKTAQPWSIMSSYNLINGRRASENGELLTGILRDEWGFDGMVTTDWYTYGEQYREIAAGNDVKMGCGMPEESLRKLREGELSREQVRTSVKRLLELILRLK